MKVTVRKLESGERVVFLLDELGVPDFWVTHFVTQKLRLSHAYTSIENFLNSIKHFKLWEKLQERDVLEEIYEGKVPSRDDILSIKEHCLYQIKVFKAPVNQKVVNMNALYLSQSNKPTVSKNQHVIRMAHIARFIHFIGQERVKHKHNVAQLGDELDDMEKLFKANMPKGGTKNKSDKSGIPDDALEDFIAVAKPSHKLNPFKSDHTKLRNYLIVQILYETGMRCSELLALKISDIGTETTRATLNVKRRHDNPDDPRLHEPTAKTLGRDIEVSIELRMLLNEYIRTYRVRAHASRKHPYIFVSHKNKTGSYVAGQPLVQRSINHIYDCIKAINPERFWGITPHLYRHYFNDRLSETIDATKAEVRKEVERLESEGMPLTAKQYANDNTITEQRELKIRADANGHSSLDSGRVYLKRTVKKQSSELRNKMHKKIQGKVGRLQND
jgi:integrase